VEGLPANLCGGVKNSLKNKNNLLSFANKTFIGNRK